MPREHVVLLDDSGYGSCRHPDGTPFLDPARHEVTLVAPAESGAGGAPVDRVIAVDVLDRREIRRILPILNNGPAVDHVAATAEPLLVPAATLRTQLGVAGYAPEHMVLFRDRTLMKQHFAAAGIRTPAHAETGWPAEHAALFERHGAVVLRPLDVTDTAPSFRFTDVHALERRVRENEEIEHRYRAEEYISDDIYCVESVVRNGRPELALAVRRLESPDAVTGAAGHRCVQLGPGGLRAILLEFNRRVLRAVSWYSGVTHLEVALDQDGLPVFRELAARAGDGAVAAFRYGFGLDLRLAALAPQVGMAPPRREIRGPLGRLSGWAVVRPPRTGPSDPIAPPGWDWVVDVEPRREASRQRGGVGGRPPGAAVVTVCGPDEETVAERLELIVRAFGGHGSAS